MSLNRLYRKLGYPLLIVLVFLMGTKGASAAALSLAAAASHGISLNAAGNACSAGENTYGQLGDGTAVARWTPVPVVGLSSSIKGISTGQYHTVAVKNDGTVWTWGYNGYGQLGTGNNFDRLTPFSISGVSSVVAVAAGQNHSLALTSGGIVWGWGYNGYGQLGDGTTTQRLTPVQVILLTNVVAIAAGQNFSLALKSDGTVWGWGYNGYGQLGDGTTTTRQSPVQVTALTGVTQIAAGAYHSMARKSDGSMWTWGYGGYGQLGNGSTSSESNIVKVTGLSTVVAIGAGDNHSLAVQSDGSVWAWGYNGYGQLGDGTTTQEATPIQVGTSTSGFSGFSVVEGGSNFSLAMQSNGTVWAWGDNTQGQFGDGITNQSLTPVEQLACAPVNSAGSGVSIFTTYVSANQQFAVSAKSDGTVWAWGDNTYGQLGDGTQINRNTPVEAAGVTGATDVSAGGFHSLAATNTGSVWTWGYNGYGELGSGNTSNRPTPLPVSNFTGAVKVAGGYYHSLVLRSDGTVWGFGYNGYGQLGDGTTTQRTSPVQAIGISGMTAIAAGQYHSLALRSDGTVWAWGNNSYGQLGNGTNIGAQSAVQVPGLSNIVAIAAGQSHNLALRNDGTVWAWGYGGYGQLGEGSTNSYYTIVNVSGLTDVIAIAAGTYHSVAVRSDGTVWSWGYNGDGELGNGTTTNSTTPVQVTGLTGALAVAAGSNDTLALTTNGSFSVWGSNADGQFGVPTPSSTTVEIQGPTGFVTTFALSTAVSPANSGTVSINPVSPGGVYPNGFKVCLMASPAADQLFHAWTGTALNAASCLTMTANSSVTANFTTNTNTTKLRFIPSAPCRVVDTRGPVGPVGGPAIGGNTSRSFTIPGNCGIPSTALAYSLNLTVVPSGTLGYVTLWPTGKPQPLASTLNSIDGRVKSNAAIVPAGTGGAVSVFATNTTNVILDIDGYFDLATDPTALEFYPLTPCRVADTRTGVGELGGPSLVGGASRIFTVLSSLCNIPSNALAYSLNFTAVPQGPLGYLTVWPSGQSQPVVSTLNAPTGEVTANAAIVPAGSAGAIELFVTNNTDMIIDVNGYFASQGAGYSLYNLTPCRIEDTRFPSGAPPFVGTIAVTATGVPCGVPPEARSLVLNATVVPSGVLGYLTLWANGGSQPVVSTLNSLDGSLTSNLALVPTTNGLVDAYAAGPSATYLILDISGYFAP